jgi:hypothetical protein
MKKHQSLIIKNSSTIIKSQQIPNRSTSTKFRLQTKDFAITYSQSSLNKNLLFDYLKDFINQKNKKIVYLLVAQEDHADHKGIHHHVFLQLDNILNIKDSRFFDFNHHHPKFERCRDIKKYIAYCKKEDTDFLEMGTPNFRRKYVRQNQKEEYKQLIYDEIDKWMIRYWEEIDLTLDYVRDQLDQFIYKTDRDYFFEEIKRIDEILKRRFKKRPLTSEEKFAADLKKNTQADFAWGTFRIFPKSQEIMDFIINGLKYLDLHGRTKSLVVESPSQYGKSQFFKAFLNYLKVRFNYIKDFLYFGPEIYDFNAKIAIFDDISLFEIIAKNLLTNLVGGQSEGLVNSKYQPIRLLPNGSLNIFLCNEHNSWTQWCQENKKLGKTNYKYIESNCYFIQLQDNEKFY